MKTIAVPYGHKPPIEVDYDRGSEGYPMALRMPKALDGKYPMLREEVEALRDALTEALEYDPTSYVQVTVQGYTPAYTYRDPSGRLMVGDIVQVPFGVSGRLKLATVTKLGKGTYRGPVKDVTARFVTEPLA